MFHDRHAPRASASSHVHPGLWPAFEAAHAWCDVGVEQARLSTKLCDDTRLLLLRATADRNAEELGRTVSDFVNSTTRDLSQTAEAVSRIWRSYLRDAVRAASLAAP